MKIIHTSDLHLASPLSTKLPSSKVASRKRELMSNLIRLSDSAMSLGAGAVIIAGDLFDSEKITRKELDTVLSIVERAENLSFFYLPGNHERDALIKSAEALPKNLYIFGKEWTYFKLGNLTIAGRSETAADMFSSLVLSANDRNIVVLHGELRDKSAEGGVIGLSDASGRNIDYMALGHYHSYSEHRIDKRGIAVYSGTPEGRGFDEVGDMGFSLVNVLADSVTNRFVPFAARRLLIKNVDITTLTRTYEVEERILLATADIDKKELVRINFVGARELELHCDKELLAEKLKDRFYYFEIKDSSKLLTRAEDYRYDKSLRGEFIRLCLNDDSLSDEEKERIIHCGLSALAGEAFDE